MNYRACLFAYRHRRYGTARHGRAGRNSTAQPSARLVRVVVWDEQQPEQKQAYDNFLGNAIAEYLKHRRGLAVRSVKFSDPEQGLSDDVLNDCDVLVWWSHYRTNPAVTTARARKVVDRIKAGKLSLVSLHSAHWSAPFVEAMRDRATEDALKDLGAEQRAAAAITVVTPERFTAPRRGAPLTPSVKRETAPTAGSHRDYAAQLLLPRVPRRRRAEPRHDAAAGAPHRPGPPKHWDIPQTEMYDEPFHVPVPDAVVFEEKWDKGEHFRSGCVWNVGKGKVFYFRPGHETYPIYKQELPLRVIENTCRWLGSDNHAK